MQTGAAVTLYLPDFKHGITLVFYGGIIYDPEASRTIRSTSRRCTDQPACERSSCQSGTRITEKQTSLTSVPEEEHVFLAHVETLKAEPSRAERGSVPPGARAPLKVTHRSDQKVVVLRGNTGRSWISKIHKHGNW